MTKARLLLTLPLLLLLVLGCQKSKTPAKLSGKVTYNGNPVTGGEMVFYFGEGGAPEVTIRSDGTYSATDLPVGEATVTIDTESINPKGKMAPAQYGGVKGAGKEKMKMSPMPEAASQSAKGEYVKIPLKYKDKKKSGLTVTLTSGEQTHDFELKD